MMGKLIDRDALRQMKVEECAGHSIEYAMGWKACIEWIKKDAPAVDAAPVVHGKWLGRRYDFKEYKYVIVPYDATTFDNPNDLFCSVCNEPALSDGAENDVPSNFCPHCGARMDA